MRLSTLNTIKGLANYKGYNFLDLALFSPQMRLEIDSPVCGPWSAGKSYNLEYLTYINT